MDTYVNAIGFEILLTKEEHTLLAGKASSLFFYDKDEDIWTLRSYKHHGLHAEIKSVKSSFEDPLYKLEFEVLLSKLLDQSIKFGGLTKRDEIEDACKQLDKVIRKIEEISGVKLLEKAELVWVALAKDVMTPNEFYSHEIIDAANDALEIYRFCDEYLRFFDVQPDKEFAAFYYENASGKIYSKKRDLLRNSYQFEVETLGEYGLLCFELIIFDAILERDYSNGNYIHLDSLHKTLYQLAIDGDTLLKKYYNCLFYEGAMLSKEVLKKHLKENHKIGKEKIENMIDFSDWIRIMGSDNMIYYGNFEDVYSQVEDFRELEISPIRVSKWCPYIPSFADMLNGTVDDKLLSFAMQVTADKEGLTYWNFDEISKSGEK